ncbi:MAG: UvrD-helicase domain-containing protein [Cyanobacteria bacterium SID2]|nr:UvrD-helicase domain-containing protein [Cyanobacteria bacterium SID2]MBP0004771.1 UvrD-helicase domain-containing protein [Cyanobacteria bacterium SBC]
MSLTPEQQRAAYARSSVAITAGAGTGKTFTMAERYLYHLQEDGLSPLQVVAVTFTEKAATELRSRIRKLARERGIDRTLLAELEAAPISTFHSLAARICREHAEAAGVPADFRILDDLEGQLWLDEQRLDILDTLPDEIYEKLPYRLLREVLPQLLDDPITVREAFRHGSEGWNDIANQLRDRAFDELLQSPIWQESTEVLQHYSGKMGDKMEMQRQTAANAIALIDSGDRSIEHLQAIASVDFRKRGSKKNWQPGHLELVTEQFKKLRDLVNESFKAELVTLQLGELDDRLAEVLPALKAAFEYAWETLTRIKRQVRVLTFADLEVFALEALKCEAVRHNYQQRFKAFLVDEFQDTNPVQAQLLDALTQTATLTIVGDAKQSIYGFRRADARVFDRFRQTIVQACGDDVSLDLCFRTHHALIDRVNQIFQPLLNDLHQTLVAHRQEAPHNDPHLQAFALTAPKGTLKVDRRRAEAKYIADWVTQLVADKTLVHDKRSDTLRPIDYGDIAILARTWKPLQVYADVLESSGIPIALAGGDSLLDTREAKDALAVLRFLADSDDDLALVAVLRSPFFAVSDRALLQIILEAEPERRDRQVTWWDRIQAIDWMQVEDAPAIDPIAVLRQLQHRSSIDPPSRVLQWLDRLTGYTAVLANLPSANRREADWRGFRELVRRIEQDRSSLYGVVRRIQRLVDEDVKVPRLPLDASNAVSLMTVHKSKGLEWPVVVVADLNYNSSTSSQTVYFDPELGVSLKFDDDFEVSGKPVLHVVLERLDRKQEEAETLRLLYVALTRARDRLMLTASQESGGYFDRLSPGLAAASIEIGRWAFPEQFYCGDLEPPAIAETTPKLLLDSISTDVKNLPFEALSDYAACPKRFVFRYLQGHPGTDATIRMQHRLDRLIRKAIAYRFRDKAVLRAFDGELDGKSIASVMEYLKQFDRSEAFASLHDMGFHGEHLVTMDFDRIQWHGSIVLLGENGILDVRTCLELSPKFYRFELAAIARKMDRSNIFLVDINNLQLYHWNLKDFQPIDRDFKPIVKNIRSNHFEATPSREQCQRCVYFEICLNRIED